MFLDELTPIVKEMMQEPIAFFGGFCSGLLRLNLNEDPIKTWLEKETGTPTPASGNPESNNGNQSGPQSITIE